MQDQENSLELETELTEPQLCASALKCTKHIKVHKHKLTNQGQTEATHAINFVEDIQ